MLDRFKFSTKITFSFGVFIIIIALNAVLSYFGQNYLIAGVEKSNKIRKIIDLIDRIRLNEKEYIIENSRNYSAEVNDLISQTIVQSNEMRRVFSDEREKNKIDEAFRFLEEYKNIFNGYLNVKDRQQALKSRAEELKQVFISMTGEKEAAGLLAGEDKANIAFLIVWSSALTDSINAGVFNETENAEMSSRLDELIDAFQKKKDASVKIDNKLFYFDVIQNFKEYRDFFFKYKNVKKMLLENEKKLKEISAQIKTIFASAIELIEGDIKSNAVRYSLFMTSLFFVSFAAAVLLALLLLKSITSPLSEFIGITQAIAGGDYSRKLAVKIKDELGELAENFNIMVENIKLSELKLVEYNDTLEARVDSRTAELQNTLDDLKKTQSQLVRAKEAAEAANRAKSDFLANMSHELRTPMNGIIGFTDLLASSGLAERQSEFTRTIKKSALHLLELINDILDLSKIEACKLTIVKSPFDVTKAVADCVSIISQQLRDKKVDIKMKIDSGINYLVNGDELRFRQILINILTNANKFTAQGSISVELTREAVNGNTVILKTVISDTGIGIPADKIDKIFEMFYQLDDSSKKRYGGAGLGLAIVRGLVEMMGGEITVESEEGKGSVFCVRIPFEIAVGEIKAAADYDKTDSGSKKGASEETARELEILLAEDDEINAAIITNMAKKYKWKVSWAQNGREAVELYLAKKFDAIIMDGQMPEMSGLEAARRIREIEAEKGGRVPIIALTAYAMSGDREKFMAAGMDDYLTKPVTAPDILKSAVMKYFKAG
ncbi:MAG TPA: ATP-binding protein [Candidatus Wallbacteria bacterium]|nr:MAG: Autoinducer 2 sensor kinase/phosphatase LuxQ [bacterium ADurb.Bin243]HOD40004.1 ATP-binding protein [Candidatus Wallbacteria bacterium]HPG58261.1 ATP-binding protein [Candidatus Wallbacteria bacterium]